MERKGFLHWAGFLFSQTAAQHWLQPVLSLPKGRRREQGKTGKAKGVSLVCLIGRRVGCAAPEPRRWCAKLTWCFLQSASLAQHSCDGVRTNHPPLASVAAIRRRKPNRNTK